jgi:hypothetical protein
MATPASGEISFSDLRTEIMQSGSGAISIGGSGGAGERLGYGTSDQISMSDLRKAWGATITCGTYTDKFGTTNGYSATFSPALGSMNSSTYTPGYGIDSIATGSGINYCYYNEAPGGYDVINNLNRFALGNSLRTISDQANVPPEYFKWSGNAIPSSGTISVGFRWG